MLGLVTQGSAIHKISSKLTLIDMFDLGCYSDPEYSKPIFSLDTSLLMMIYHQIKLVAKDSLVYNY